MDHMVLEGIAGGAAMAAMVALGGQALRFRKRGQEEDVEPEVRSPLIRVLRTEDELQEAVRRAAEFEERVVLSAVRNRRARYEALIRPPTLKGIDGHRSNGTVPGPGEDGRESDHPVSA